MCGIVSSAVVHSEKEEIIVIFGTHRNIKVRYSYFVLVYFTKCMINKQFW